MNKKLQQAVKLFEELGWQNVTPETIATHSTGTPEQKRTALEGLKSGEWGKYVHSGDTQNNTYRSVWQPYFPNEYRDHMALFAVAVGVSVARADEVLSMQFRFRASTNEFDRDLSVGVVKRRGAKFAAAFVERAARFDWAWVADTHHMHGRASILVRIVDEMNLELPQSADYISRWAGVCANVLGLDPAPANVYGNDRNAYAPLPLMNAIQRRFEEHVTTGIALNVSGTDRFFGAVIVAGVTQDWISRTKALEHALTALDASLRPADRKAWIRTMDELGITDMEIVAHAQSIIPILTQGDNAVVTRFAPVLIAGADESLLVEILLASFTVDTKKARIMMLKAAAERTRPNGADELAPWLAIFAEDSDRKIATLAARLASAWDVTVERLPEDAAEVAQLWQPTPNVWTCPDFHVPEITFEQLTDEAAEVSRIRGGVYDIHMERFLAQVVACAYRDAEETRAALRGIKNASTAMLDNIAHWVAKKTPEWGFDADNSWHTKDGRAYGVMAARSYVVSQNLGVLPILLSTPSKVDLTIIVPDLVSRIAKYKELGLAVQEADMFLALMRLDLSTKQITPQEEKQIAGLDVQIMLQSGKPMHEKAGAVLLAYLKQPLQEPVLSLDKKRWVQDALVVKDTVLKIFPNRIPKYFDSNVSSACPTFGDWALCAFGGTHEGAAIQALAMQQAAHRAAPLPPGASINFLAAPRNMKNVEAAGLAMEAVLLAWQRGLLRPGVADLKYLDWNTHPPKGLAALAEILESLARDGLLSVIWPVLDGLITQSANSPRIHSGTAELVELLAKLLPEVEHATKQGLADASALDLPGVRALAERGGTSKVIVMANEVVAKLPLSEKPTTTEIMRPHDEVWPVAKKSWWHFGKKEPVVLEDGVEVSVELAEETVSWKTTPNEFVRYVLTLPDKPGARYRLTEFLHDHRLIEHGILFVYIGGSSRRRGIPVYLHYDAAKKGLVTLDPPSPSEGRSYLTPEETQKFFSSIGVKPLSLGIITLLIAKLAEEKIDMYALPHIISKYIENGQINALSVRRAVQTLLHSPAISPMRLTRMLENDVLLLPVFWPMLTESVRRAGEIVQGGESIPKWLNRILDISVRYAPYLAEAARRGQIPQEDARWVGLDAIAGLGVKSTAVGKARELLGVLT